MLNGNQMLILAAVYLAAYFLGNISPSTILARARGIDIKKEGSGNAGTTNALRVMGKKAAIITLVVDILKGVVAVLLGWLAAGQIGAMGCTLAVMLGHVWPIVFRFKGGKGVATSFGALLALNPLIALIELLIVAVATLISKRMSLGSVTGIILLPAVAFWRMPEFTGIAVILAVVMLIKHRENIVRLVHGEEPKLGFLDKDKKEKNE
ncbi:MAG: glycerol-3-phosphate 1-O-acyltransferase PlsY [Firmicutes bacterium]|nr:glycerol-3-phosphate 1-O-acyltransferase PlsY [Bacillota bacterium]